MSAPRCDVSPWLLPREREPEEPDDGPASGDYEPDETHDAWDDWEAERR